MRSLDNAVKSPNNGPIRSTKLDFEQSFPPECTDVLRVRLIASAAYRADNDVKWIIGWGDGVGEG